MLLVRARLAAAFAPLIAGCNSDVTTDAPHDRASPPAEPAPSREPARDGVAPRWTKEGASFGAGPYVPFDVNHILSTGQSNSVGNDALPPLTTTQPYANVMFDVGVITASSCEANGCTKYDVPTRFVPLVEGDTYFAAVETMSSSLANQITKLARLHGKSHDALVSVHGRSGYSYGCLRKGGCDWWQGKSYVKPFDDGMMQVRDAMRLAKAAGKSYVVRAVTAIHGEHDHASNAKGSSYFPMRGTDGVSTLADYGDALLEWQRDYESGVKALTGQSIPIPLFVSQYSHWTDAPTTTIAYQQMSAHRRSKGAVVVVGPTYAFEYSSECLHFRAHAERQLGEMFARAYTATIIEGRRWEPLRPRAISIAGNVITARFLVPKPPLVLDVVKVTNPGDFGFEYTDASDSPPAIARVALDGPDAVKITLTSAPAGPEKRLRYAFTQRGGCVAGRPPARGNLRDSDDTPSQNGYALPNWSVHFDEPID
ncbi:MAG: hypothetical protein KF819_31715 [Labilithrix sp.]|nr:hypothetical protein [Labilithrix sp.]